MSAGECTIDGVEGKVHWIRAKEATGWIPEFSEDEEDDDHSEQEFISSEQSDLGLHIDGEDNGTSDVPEIFFENSDGMKERQSEDSFGLYSILNKNKVKSDVIREVNDENPSLKYPPGFTPSVEKNGSKSKDDQVQNISDNQLNGDNESVHQVEREDNRNSDGAKTNSIGSRKFKMSEIPRTGRSILSVMEEIIKVGLAQKAKKDWVKELCNKNKVSFVGLQETKMESIDLLSVRLCWGNVNFDYVHSDSIGNSGGILCIWDPNSFRKDSVTVSDYFVIVRGVWIKSGMDILIVVSSSGEGIYLVPQIASENRQVWIDSWKDAPGDDSNAMRNLCGRATDHWKNCIDKGNGSDEMLTTVLEILGKLQQVNKAQASRNAMMQYSGNSNDLILTTLVHDGNAFIVFSGLRVNVVPKARLWLTPYVGIREVVVEDFQKLDNLSRLVSTDVTTSQSAVVSCSKISSGGMCDYVEVFSYEEWEHLVGISLGFRQI
ncbi:RNA-directed DNA polymerase, eukaryota [Tanacetum coccineum]